MVVLVKSYVVTHSVDNSFSDGDIKGRERGDEREFALVAVYDEYCILYSIRVPIASSVDKAIRGGHLFSNGSLCTALIPLLD